MVVRRLVRSFGGSSIDPSSRVKPAPRRSVANQLFACRAVGCAAHRGDGL